MNNIIVKYNNQDDLYNVTFDDDILLASYSMDDIDHISSILLNDLSMKDKLRLIIANELLCRIDRDTEYTLITKVLLTKLFNGVIL